MELLNPKSSEFDPGVASSSLYANKVMGLFVNHCIHSFLQNPILGEVYRSLRSCEEAQGKTVVYLCHSEGLTRTTLILRLLLFRNRQRNASVRLPPCGNPAATSAAATASRYESNPSKIPTFYQQNKHPVQLRPSSANSFISDLGAQQLVGARGVSLLFRIPIFLFFSPIQPVFCFL